MSGRAHVQGKKIQRMDLLRDVLLHTLPLHEVRMAKENDLCRLQTFSQNMRALKIND